MSLDSLEIKEKIHADNFEKTSFLGVFPFYVIPAIHRFPASLVINTHPKRYPGEHWLAVFFDSKDSCDFFDSFGFPPKYYDLEKYINRFSKNYMFNRIQLQSNDSDLCGYYCIQFILLKARCFSLDDIISLFDTKDHDLNDFLIKNVL